MYETNPTRGESEKACKPDYEKMAAKQKKELATIEDFKESLIEFVAVVGGHSFKREVSSIPELLGTVELDIINRQKQYQHTLEMIEKDK